MDETGLEFFNLGYEAGVVNADSSPLKSRQDDLDRAQIEAPAMAAQSPCVKKVEELALEIDGWAWTARRVAKIVEDQQSPDELAQSLDGLSKRAREAASQCEAEKAGK